MKTKCIFLMTLCAFVCMLGYSRTNIPLSTEIPIGGGGARTPVPSPTAYLDDDEVQVILSVAAPLTITVCGQAGNCLFSKEYASTQEAIIPLSENGITQGDYVLRVFSQGLCWKGNFTIEASKQAPASIGAWWYDWNGKMDIKLVSDDGQPLDSLQCFLSVADIIYIGHVNPQYYRYLANLMRQDSTLTIAKLDTTTVVVTRAETNDTVFMRGYRKCDDPKLQLNYLGFTNGDYKINVQWRDCWWRGEFTFKTHWPEGDYVYVDSTYYRLNGRNATTVEPDYIAGHSITYRKLWDIFERDYPLHVVIPSELTYKGETYQVVGLEKKSFKWCYYLLSVTLPNTITFIDQGAFMECKNLRRIDIPESVTSIGTGVFDGCVKLSYIEIPEGITAIKDHTFNCCTSLSAVTLPSSLTTIERVAFSGCTSLPYIDIPDGVTSIGEYAFSDCEDLMGIKLPRELTQIDNHAFYNCKMLTSVEIPELVRTIDDYAFYKCAKLTSVTLPENMIKIGVKAFFDMPSSGHIYCDAKEPFTISANTFNYKCTLHVPYGCKEKYQKSANWKNFTNIEEMEKEESGEEVRYTETGVTSATLDAESAERFYDLQGRPVDGTQKGILIRNGKKVLVK